MPTGWRGRGRCIRTRSSRWRTACSSRRTRRPIPTLAAPDWVDALGGDYLYAHVASPDAHIDEPNRRIVMYYHGLLRDGDQQTRLATSTDGLHFTPQAPLLGPPYFRATRLDGVIYLSMWEGRLGRMTSWEGPVELAPPIHDGYHLPPHVSGRDPSRPANPGDARSATAMSLRMTGGFT